LGEFFVRSIYWDDQCRDWCHRSNQTATVGSQYCCFADFKLSAGIEGYFAQIIKIIELPLFMISSKNLNYLGGLGTMIDSRNMKSMGGEYTFTVSVIYG
jgi:hypothetical protein